MHGIEVNKEPPGDWGYPRRTSAMWIARISVRYEDGRVLNFIPEAGEEVFSQDETRRLVKVMRDSAATLEWGNTLEEYANPE